MWCQWKKSPHFWGKASSKRLNTSFCIRELRGRANAPSMLAVPHLLRLWEASACRELTRTEGFLGYLPISANLWGTLWCVSRHCMTVQSAPTVSSDVNKTVSFNNKYRIIFSVFPGLHKYFLLKPPDVIFCLIYPVCRSKVTSLYRGSHSV